MQFDRGNPELPSLFCLPNFITMAQMLSFVTLQLHVFISLSLNMTLTNDYSTVPRSQEPLRIEILFLRRVTMHTARLAVLISSSQGDINSTETLSPIGITYLYQQRRSTDSPSRVNHQLPGFSTKAILQIQLFWLPITGPWTIFHSRYSLWYPQPKLHCKLQLCHHCYFKCFSPIHSILFQREIHFCDIMKSRSSLHSQWKQMSSIGSITKRKRLWFLPR